MEAGLDSLGAMALRNSVSQHFAIDLPPTLVFNHPSIAAIAALLAQSLPLGEAEPIRPADFAASTGPLPALGMQDVLGVVTSKLQPLLEASVPWNQV